MDYSEFKEHFREGANKQVISSQADSPGKIHEHARIYRLRSVAGSQILNFMS
ncbi:hypothetical protein HUC26_22360 [Escherichia coli]|nr:hypothetical protein [Escherichia coli]